jgi:hypothetical protein
MDMYTQVVQAIYPMDTISTKRSSQTVQQRQHVLDFLPSAVLGEAFDFTVDGGGLEQKKRERLDGCLQRTPIILWERELLPVVRY